MAERATAERVGNDMRPANFRGAVQRLRTIKPKKERIAGINGEIGGIYDAVEGFKVNKKAARIFLTLDGLEPDEQQDIFRSLTGLIDAAGWEKGDLVDQAEGADDGKIVTPDFRGRRKADATENDAGEDREIDETMRDVEQMPAEGEPAAGEEPVKAEEAPKKKRGDRVSPAEARERAKAHFGKGEAPPVGTSVEPEAFTGDNSDLNPE